MEYDYRDRFYDEHGPEPKVPTCRDCNLCMVPDDGFTDDENIGFCLDCQEFCHLDWESEECESFAEM